MNLGAHETHFLRNRSSFVPMGGHTMRTSNGIVFISTVLDFQTLAPSADNFTPEVHQRLAVQPCICLQMNGGVGLRAGWCRSLPHKTDRNKRYKSETAHILG